MAAPQDAAAADAGAIAVVVVSHESAATIDAALDCLRASVGVTEIRVVDNASTDGTVEAIQRHALADPRVRFIANPDNPGFAMACNQGAAATRAPWLAFVNPDCAPAPDALARLRAHAAGRGACLVGSDLVDADGRHDPAARRRDPDFAAMLRRPWRAGDLAVAAEGVLQPVDAVSGAVMLMPRALFAHVGGFDEGYRLHAEDLDLCRRVRAAGGVVAVANDVAVLHLRGVSSRARPLFVEWHKHRGLWRYFRRFEAPRRAVATRAAVWCAIWARFALTALRLAAR
jgi:N-acetylglucosaminyl-diphospho-decaprenol L-rhamnosyltransferase